ncbi:MAG: DUF1292 domain-containing protein [Myxococcota bacterium]
MASHDGHDHEDEDLDDDDIVTLSDAEGNETDFQFLGVVEVEGEDYALLTPANDEEATETEIFIFRYEQDEDGGEIFSDVEDEETFQKVRAQAEALFASLEEGDEEEELDA